MQLGIVSQLDARPIGSYCRMLAIESKATAIIANIRLTAVPTSQNHIAILRRLRIECPFVPTPPFISRLRDGRETNVFYEGIQRIYNSTLQLQLISPTYKVFECLSCLAAITFTEATAAAIATNI